MLVTPTAHGGGAAPFATPGHAFRLPAQRLRSCDVCGSHFLTAASQDECRVGSEVCDGDEWQEKL